MKLLLVRLLCCAAAAAGLVSCVDVAPYPPYHGGYGYNQGYNQGYYAGNSNYRHEEHHEHHEVHCYCNHKSCGCKPGHPKGGCYCDKGEHRH